MANSSGTNAEEIRAKAREIGERAKSDPDFAQQLTSDPGSTLVAAGLPEDAASDFIREDGLGDVSGYIDSCSFTCLCTNACCYTGSITAAPPPGRMPPGGR